jgi:hypothetical protein
MAGVTKQFDRPEAGAAYAPGQERADDLTAQTPFPALLPT